MEFPPHMETLIGSLLTYLLILSSIVSTSADKFQNWSYNDTTEWCSISHTCCGHNQSPIDLHANERPIVGKRFRATGYFWPPYAMKAENNGHTVTFVVPGYHSRKITISSGGLPRHYAFAGFNFHWGNQTKGRTEHTLDGKHFDMEMHMIHYKDIYPSLKHAIISGKSDALAIFAIWIKEGSENVYFKPLVRALQNTRHKGQWSYVYHPPALVNLMPIVRKKYFRYSGSLTVPDCDEVVTWSIFRNPVMLSRYQILEFHRLFATKESAEFREPLTNNCRPVQKVRGRPVWFINAN